MTEDIIRIGIVGAGANTRLRHIPGFQAISGVEIHGVVNSSPESTAKAAEDFEIPKTYTTWQELVADPEIDAVMIGTWPDLHCEITCAALEAGKHVLTEARMARNVAEARQMLDVSDKHPDLVAQIVPSPFGLKHHDFLQDLIVDNFLGDLREVVVIGADDTFWDYTNPIHWRQDAEISGFNVLTLGIMHETVSRLIPKTVRVTAQTAIFEVTRPEANGPADIPVTVPDSVHVMTQLEGGARGIYHFSGIDLFGPGRQIHLYGSRGTIKLICDQEEQLFTGRLKDPELTKIELAPEKQGFWRVEEEFICAIRGEESVQLTDFKSGVAYMEFTEAVANSAKTSQPVDLPL